MQLRLSRNDFTEESFFGKIVNVAISQSLEAIVYRSGLFLPAIKASLAP
jgi:hypothetical protein